MYPITLTYNLFHKTILPRCPDVGQKPDGHGRHVPGAAWARAEEGKTRKKAYLKDSNYRRSFS